MKMLLSNLNLVFFFNIPLSISTIVSNFFDLACLYSYSTAEQNYIIFYVMHLLFAFKYRFKLSHELGSPFLFICILLSLRNIF